MDPLQIWQAAILGMLQGATEFLPVSSSGHLVLVPWALNWPVPSLAFDTMAHWGTLLAVLLYFWRDFLDVARGWLGALWRRQPAAAEARLGWLLILGTLPAMVMGLAGEDFFASLFAAPAWAAFFLLVTTVILVLSERYGRGKEDIGALRWWEALLIGLAQGFAIAPGISRSGATIAVGLLLGLRRPAAARFSFMLSAPIVFGAGLIGLSNMLSEPVAGVSWTNMLVGFLTAAVVGYLCIRFLLAYLQRGKLYPFAIYTALAGSAALLLYVVR